jgi:hypothetical protein
LCPEFGGGRLNHVGRGTRPARSPADCRSHWQEPRPRTSPQLIANSRTPAMDQPPVHWTQSGRTLRRPGCVAAEILVSRIEVASHPTPPPTTHCPPPPNPPTHSAIPRVRRPATHRPATTPARSHTPEAGVESAAAPPPDHCMASVIEGNCRHPGGSPAPTHPARAPTQEPTPQGARTRAYAALVLEAIGPQAGAKIMATSPRGQEGVRVSESQRGGLKYHVEGRKENRCRLGE